MPVQYVLYEAASGYALFQLNEMESIAAKDPEVQKTITDMGTFGRMVTLKAFQAFDTAANALENINAISENLVTDDLKSFLEANLPKHKAKEGKEPKFYLGVIDPKFGTAVQDACKLPVNSNETVTEVVRGCRLHLDKFISGLEGGVLEKSQLGLSHSYSRAKVKFNVNRADNMIIQSICLLDQLDKDLNTFAMRVREWYSWHFPEMAKIVKDNYMYARLAVYLGNRGTLSSRDADEVLAEVTKIVLDEDIAKSVISASKTSMGMDMAEVDMTHIDAFARKLVRLAEFRSNLSDYMSKKMSVVAPNLGALIGEPVAARLISHAGSLTNLAKCPASTVQILGAEKALFRALKTRSNTPKYGLIFHSSFIGRAGAKNKGRISRYLANKCAMSARIDAFSDVATSTFGEKMRDQVEERLKFYDTGETPRKNLDVMREAVAEAGPLTAAADEVLAGGAGGEPDKKAKKSKKDKKAKKASKRSRDSDDDEAGGEEEEEEEIEAVTPAKKMKKEKKAKSEKKSSKKKKKKSKE